MVLLTKYFKYILELYLVSDGQSYKRFLALIIYNLMYSSVNESVCVKNQLIDTILV